MFGFSNRGLVGLAALVLVQFLGMELLQLEPPWACSCREMFSHSLDPASVFLSALCTEDNCVPLPEMWR